MERVSDFLSGVARRLARPEAALAWLRSAWPSIVGPALAAHTRPSACHAGVLEIAADGHGWRAELEAMKPQFCERVNHAWGAALVRDVKFTASRAAARPSREADNNHLPFIRRRR